MSALKPNEFESAEPRGFAHRPFSKSKRRPQKIRKPPTKKKLYATRYKKLYEKVRELEYTSFEEWLANLTGSDAPQIRQHAREYREQKHVIMR